MFVRAATQLRSRSVPLACRASRARFSSDALATVDPAASKVSAHVPEQPQADTATVSTFTGAPKEMLDTRVIKIFKPAQGVQNATQNTLMWKIQWEDERTERWTNPLMGWTGTRDPLSNTHMTMEFNSAEEAARFAQRNGWKYEVMEPPSPNLAIASKGPKKYADNFKWKGPKGRNFPALYEPPPPPPKK
uniref:NADH dehydrogenase [ubiquinone] iron-sulfur protein 4, mitochondrial n=1 Tax=Calcidiscus leptoporus TaxID=127549 RepID=A0A7S0IXR3_9EUKA